MGSQYLGKKKEIKKETIILCTYVLTVPGCKERDIILAYLFANSLECNTLASFEWPYRAQTEKPSFMFMSEKIMPCFGASFSCASLDTFTIRTVLAGTDSTVFRSVGSSSFVSRKCPR
jgi:hypothetical protein